MIIAIAFLFSRFLLLSVKLSENMFAFRCVFSTCLFMRNRYNSVKLTLHHIQQQKNFHKTKSNDFFWIKGMHDIADLKSSVSGFLLLTIDTEQQFYLCLLLVIKVWHHLQFLFMTSSNIILQQNINALL